jgi:hypothetical protein
MKIEDEYVRNKNDNNGSAQLLQQQQASYLQTLAMVS